LRRKIERVVTLAHERSQLPMDDADHCLAGREAADYILPERFLPNCVEENAHYRKRHIGFEKSHAHFAHRVPDIVFCDPGFAAECFQHARQTRAQGFEHEGNGML
jgi:hypothetical protein